jgi:hypothetical protein
MTDALNTEETVTEQVTAEMVDTMTKDDLEVFALAEFGVELNKANKVAMLREEVKALLAKNSDINAAKADPVVEPVKQSTHLKNTSTGMIFETTELLLKYSDAPLVPCDKDGNPV